MLSTRFFSGSGLLPSHPRRTLKVGPTQAVGSHFQQRKSYKTTSRIISGQVCTIFGSGGFLGSYVASKLAQLGVQLILPYRGEEYNVSHLKVLGEVGQIAMPKWDIRDHKSIHDLVCHSNIVINCVHLKADTRNFNMHKTNVEAAERIATIAVQSKIPRLIHLSTAGFDPNSSCEWIRTKSLGELAVRKHFPDVTVIRPTTMIGIDDSFLTRLSEQIRYWPFFPVLAPDRLVQPVYVDDVAEGIMASVINPKTMGKTYELGGPDIWTQQEIYELLFKVLYYSPKLLRNPEWLLKPLTKYVIHYHRLPRYTMDFFNQVKLDNVVSPGALQFEDLGISQSEVRKLERVVLNIVRRYRRPKRYDEIVDEEWFTSRNIKISNIVKEKNPSIKSKFKEGEKISPPLYAKPNAITSSS